MAGQHLQGGEGLEPKKSVFPAFSADFLPHGWGPLSLRGRGPPVYRAWPWRPLEATEHNPHSVQEITLPHHL